MLAVKTIATKDGTASDRIIMSDSSSDEKTMLANALSAGYLPNEVEIVEIDEAKLRAEIAKTAPPAQSLVDRIIADADGLARLKAALAVVKG